MLHYPIEHLYDQFVETVREVDVGLLCHSDGTVRVGPCGLTARDNLFIHRCGPLDLCGMVVGVHHIERKTSERASIHAAYRI